ncbi:capsule assembly Wzi family protein [Algoriphagus mannitolivorans]|uniref:capsule assembly Wzi family protein n=1 Tax=Algoriphagus mannitolivorans TaxID=226504 RepID=UPI0012FC482B|nr:capsule assembly Wzi family protein [Algoriphagus mannitolivorans]
MQVSYRFNPDNLTTYGDRLMVPAAGHQGYLTLGFFARLGQVSLQVSPEVVFAENKPFPGFSQNLSPEVTYARFIYWNNGDNPERFGISTYSKIWWGQSKLSWSGRSLEFYIGTQNISWGPGQFNSLIFSANASGFPHVSFNTVNPLKTFLGSFEGQVIVGRLENSFFDPSQHDALNQTYFLPFESDWRYLNGFTINYQPKWLKGIYVGLNRTFQVNNNLLGNSFKDYFPIFEIFQKENFFENGNSLVYDSKGTDQQVSVFARIVSKKAKAEVYFEFGRRDHSFNWREFILNPEHARAYILGFQKLVSLARPNNYLQFRGEIVHQQESVNRYIRYLGLGGNLTWHTHGTSRGFTNFGQGLGVGIGTGSNSQLLEVSKANNESKIGIRFSRLENNQDFFYRAFGQMQNANPWVDFGIGLIYEKQWSRLTLSSKIDGVGSNNFQWESYQNPPPSIKGSPWTHRFMGQINLIYSLKSHR